MKRLLLIALLVASSADAQWEVLQAPAAAIADLYFADSLHGWVAGYYGIYHSTDGGDTWSQQSSQHVNHIVGVNSRECWATGLNNMLFHTIDAGQTWAAISLASVLDSISTLGRPCFIDSMHGWIPANRRLATWVLRTTNAGATWSASRGDQAYGFNPICTFVDSLSGWATGGTPELDHTTDGGATWTFLSYIPSAVHGLRFLTQELGWAIRSSGVNEVALARSTNGGQLWSNDYFGAWCGFSSFSFIDTAHGWLVEPCIMQIKYTSDCGETWSPQFTYPISGYMSTMYFADDSHGWVTIYMGTILFRTRNGGVTSVSNSSADLPGSFTLSQNYPNPFNPQTTIRFELPRAQHIHLAVYDPLGRMVATLLNETLMAGPHDIPFNAAELASGVYIYRLQAGPLSQARKLVVLR